MASQLSISRVAARERFAPSRPPAWSLRFTFPRASLVIMALLALAVLVLPHFAPYDAAAIDPRSRLLPPSAAHLFGTDAFGRDLFSRVLAGIQPSLGVAGGAVLLGLIPGVLLGLCAGFERRWFDQIVTQVMDAWIALPGVLVALVMVAALGRSLPVLTVALGIASIPTFYRVVRAETMCVSGHGYVEAAHALGAPQAIILLRHVLPNVSSTIIVLAAVSVGRMLLATSGLSFIGLGAPPPSPEWGGLLAEGRDYMIDYPWMMWFPGVAIMLVTFAFYLLANTLRDRE